MRFWLKSKDLRQDKYIQNIININFLYLSIKIIFIILKIAKTRVFYKFCKFKGFINIISK